MKVIVATKGFRLWFLNKLNLDGFTCYNGTIWLKPDLCWVTYERVLKHEAVHIEQMKQDGKILFTIKYLYYWIRYGYKANPYEVQARKFARQEI